jgi:broad specificity phosphatase PhoE
VKWYIVRHADKEPGEFYNPSLRIYDQPISTRGQAQAQALARYFADKLIAKIFVSHTIRTAQTAEPTARQLDLTPVVDARLNEINNGLIGMRSETEIQQQFPEVWAALCDRDRDFRFPEGESGTDAQQRIRSFLGEHLSLDQNLLLVSHDGWIRLLICTLLDLPVYRRWEFQVDTCGILEIEYQPPYGKWKIIRFNLVCS